MPLPADLTESALAEWLRDNATPGNRSLLKRDWEPVARAVRELVEDRVRHALWLFDFAENPPATADQVVKFVMGAP